jgi:hypothetical protein
MWMTGRRIVDARGRARAQAGASPLSIARGVWCRETVSGRRSCSLSLTEVCVGPDEEHCIDEAYRLWPNEGLPGELPQVLPTVRHFEQAVALVTRDMIAESTPTGPDAGPIVDAGFDEVYVSQIGQDWPFF